MNTPIFQEPTYCYKVESIKKIVDGDTVDFLLDAGLNIFAMKRIRFLDIDTWETRGPNKVKGKAAKKFLADYLDEADEIFCQTVMDATGKYGRLLGWVWMKKDGNIFCVNNVLFEENHCKDA